MLGNQDALNKSNPWENQYYPWMQTYNLDGNYPMGGNLTTGYYQKAYRIEDLSWEKSTTWGIGLDAIINHVTFTFDYYDRKTTDIIMEVPVPTEFGLDPYFDNVGSMRNRGVEVQLGYNNKWNDWSLNVMGNMAYNKNKIEDLGGVDRMTNPDDGVLLESQSILTMYIRLMAFSNLMRRHSNGWIPIKEKTATRSDRISKPVIYVM